MRISLCIKNDCNEKGTLQNGANGRIIVFVNIYTNGQNLEGDTEK